MKLTARIRTVAVAALVILAGASGGILGVRLGNAASKPNVERVTVVAPQALAGPPQDAARSSGGFTGFGGPPALRGEVQRSGAVQSVEPGALVIGSAESSVTVRYTTPERLFRITQSTAPLRPGDLLQVRIEGNIAAALLRLPSDLEQGGNRAR